MLPIDKYQIAFNKSKRTQQIKYIVIHDSGNTKPKADDVANYNYFNTGDRQSSADFFLDDNSISQINDYNKYFTWHCGDGNGRYGVTNANSIGVELCVNSDSNYDIAFNNLIDLTKYLMKELNIPIERVVRHYDCSRKVCPASMSTNNWEKWSSFKKSLLEITIITPDQGTIDCTNELLWRKIITNQPLWNTKSITNENIKFLFQKYYPYIIKNGGSIKSKNIDCDTALSILQKQGIINDISYWNNLAYNDNEVYQLLINIADYIMTENAKPITKSYQKNGIYFTEIPVEKFKIQYWDKPKVINTINNYMNLGYFAKFDEDGVNFTLPVANLVADIDISKVPQVVLKYLNISNGKVCINCYQNSGNQFKNKQVSTLVIDENGAHIAKYNSLGDNVKYAISGAPIILNGKDPSWKNEVSIEGWDSSICRATWHGFLTVKDNKIIYIAMETKTSNCFTSSEVYNRLKGYGFDTVLKIDAGGSFQYVVDGQVLATTSENRRINSIGMFE